jgi:parallel beta-helix repeat protein
VNTYKTKIRPLVSTGNLYHVLPRPDDKVWDGVEYFDPAAKKGTVYVFRPNAETMEGDGTMDRRAFLASCGTGVALVGLMPQTFADDRIPGQPAPTIRFFEDHRKVRIESALGRWTFVRPVISPWNYQATGKTLWVANSGNDSGDGTTSRPLQTIAKALDLAGPGDVIYVRPGVYIEILRIRKSGREDAPIILSCAPDALGKVKVTPCKEYVEKNPSGAVIMLHGVRHVWINGLVIEGPKGRPEAPRAETYGANGITWAGKAGTGCRATNNVVYGNVHCGLKEMGHGGTGILMEANIIFDNGTRSTDHGIYCPADELTIRGNIIFKNAGYGIHSYSHPRRQRIVQNICFGNRVCGIILAGSENQLHHNVCTGNGIGIFYFRAGSTDNVVQNNIFAFNGTDCGYDNGGGRLGDPARNIDDYNCYYPGKPEPRVQPGGHEILADPQFIDAKAGDYRLREDSPCVAKAVKPKGLGFDAMNHVGAFQ